jgi:hypothetical protein
MVREVVRWTMFLQTSVVQKKESTQKKVTQAVELAFTQP